ncbi:MAG: hypothetical protein M5U09_18795 [Gammaproteobacteria bacterium]|nr:hypothetical protein [Gammaproteobacteria bacterium]
MLDVVRIAETPVVIDADGLNVLAGHPGALARATAPVVLTPHPGRDGPPPGLQRGRGPGGPPRGRPTPRRPRGRRRRAEGRRTLVATPDGQVGLNPTGNPGLGSAGTGDVLAGLLGGCSRRVSRRPRPPAPGCTSTAPPGTPPQRPRASAASRRTPCWPPSPACCGAPSRAAGTPARERRRSGLRSRRGGGSAARRRRRRLPDRDARGARL